MEPPILNPQGDAAGAQPELIKEATTETFMTEVIEASREVPVIVDFWAPWCGPCKQLTPTLEKVVREAGGAVRLVKVNVDENQVLAGQMGVQSIPTVFAFANGRPVDAFMGALPESQIKAFLDRLGAAAGAAPQVEEAADEIEVARTALEAGETERAAQIFAARLERDAKDVEAIAGLAACYAEIGDFERAEAVLAQAPPEEASHPGLAAVRAKLELAKDAPDRAERDALEAKVAQAGDDWQARYDLARALNAAGERDGAAEQLMAIIARKPDWNDEAARKLLLQFFEAWGPQDPATVAGRQKLSSLLFA